MKNILIMSATLLALAVSVEAANFAPGNLVVYRMGDGSTVNTLTNTGSMVFLDEYQTNGTFVQSVPMPTNYWGGYAPLVGSGVASTEGEMTLSVDGRLIVLTGFAGIIGQSNNVSLSTTSATSVPRVVGLVDQFGHIDTTTAQTNSFSSSEDVRSATSTDGTNLWFSGDNGGGGSIRYTGRGSSLATNLTSLVNNLRQINIFSNALYFSTASGSAIRIGTVTNAMPVTTSGAFQASLTGTPTSVGSPYGFVLLHLSGSTNALNTLYYADDTPGAIYKYSLVGGIWVSNGFITASNVRGLTGNVDGSGNVHLYTTTAQAAVAGTEFLGGGFLLGYTDSAGWNSPPTNNGGDLGDFFDFAVSASSRKVFRGVAFAPSGGESFPVGPARISVGPINGFTTSGFTGGPFGATKIYSIANPGTNSVTSWSATTDVNWVTLTPSSGSLASSGSVSVTVSINANANSLIPGTNLATITFTNSTSGNTGSDVTTRPVTLIVSQIGVSPSSNYFASGPVNGPFTPSSQVYTLTNGSSANSLTWGASILFSNWLTLSATSGTLAAGGTTNITVSVTNANAIALSRGGYGDTVAFTNSTASDPGNATRSVSLLIGGGFTSNNLVIYRAGDGVLAINNQPTPVFIDEFTRSGVLVQSIPVSTNNYSCSGNATAEGLMTRSTDKQYLVFVGYGTNRSYGASAPASSNNVVPRVVGRVDGNGNVDVTTRLTDFNSGGNPRAAVSTNGVDMWVAGNNGGIRHTTLGSTNSSVVCTNPTLNFRALNIFSNQLYAGSGSATIRITTVGTGLPTTDIGAAVNLPGYSTTELSPYNFVLFKLKAGGTDPYDTLYVADDNANNAGTPAGGGAIYKWSLVSGTWTSNGFVNVTAVRGLAGDVSISGTTTNVNLFAVGSGNSGGTLTAYTDTNGWNVAPVGNGGSNGTAIASAPSLQAWRSIALAPEIPATAALSLTPGDFIVTDGPSTVTTNSKNYLVSDVSNSSMTWTATWTSSWLSLSHYGGTLPAGGNTNVTVSFNGNATNLANGTYLDTITFVNTNNGQGNTTRGVSLTITGSTVVADLFITWQEHYGLSGGNALGTADPDADGMSNTNEFQAGFNPTNAAAYLHIINIARTDGTNVTVAYLGASGDSTYSGGPTSRTNVLEVSQGTGSGSYSNNYVSAGITNVLSGGTGLGQTASMVHTNGATGPTKYYRVRVLLP